MRFADYNLQHEHLRLKVRAEEDAHQGPAPEGGRKHLSEWGSYPSHRVIDAFWKQHARRYWISDRAYVDISPQGSAKLPYCATVSVRMTYGGEQWTNTSPQPHHLTPAEHHEIGDVIKVVDEWIAGERDALPPSGPWAMVRT